jgi:hypothetical protein
MVQLNPQALTENWVEFMVEVQIRILLIDKVEVPVRILLMNE